MRRCAAVAKRDRAKKRSRPGSRWCRQDEWPFAAASTRRTAHRYQQAGERHPRRRDACGARHSGSHGLHENIWNTDRNRALHLTASGYSLCIARGLSPSGCRCGLSNGCNSRIDPRRHRSAWVSGIRRCNESCCAGSCGTVGISEGIQARIPCGFLVPQRLDRLPHRRWYPGGRRRNWRALSVCPRQAMGHSSKSCRRSHGWVRPLWRRRLFPPPS